MWQDSTTPNAYGAGQLLPQSVVLTYTPEDANGKALYSVDADKSMDISIDTNILASLVRCLHHSAETLFELTDICVRAGTSNGEVVDDGYGSVLEVSQVE